MTKKLLIYIAFITILWTLLAPGLIAQDKKDQDLAMMFYREGNYEKAAALYQRLYEADPKQYYYTYLLFCWLETGEFREAEKLVKKQLKGNSDQSRYLVDLGYVFIRKGDVQEAEKYFREAIQNTSGSKGAIISLANAFMSRQQTDYSLEAYRRGRELNKEYAFRAEIAQVYERLGRFQEMLDEYLLMLEEDPSTLTLVQNKLQSGLADDPEGKRNESFRETLLRKIQKEPAKVYFSDLLLWHAVQQKDFDLALIQARSMDKRLGEDGERVYDLALLAAANKDYSAAIEALEYVIGKGEVTPYYMLATVTHLKVRFDEVMEHYDFAEGALAELEDRHKELIEAYGYNEISQPLIRNLAKLQAFYLDQPQDAIALLEQARQIGNLSIVQQAEIKLELGDIYLFTGEVWEATLLYSQVDKSFKNDPVGHMAKLKNAKLSFYIGEFDWAKAQLDVLKAATSKLIANDAMELSLIIGDNQEDDSTQVALQMYASADLFLYRNKVDSAVMLLNALEAKYTWHPILDEVLMKKAKIFLKLQQFGAADSVYALVLEKYPTDIHADDALYQRGILAEEKFNAKDKAMEFYEQLMFEYPGSLYVVSARKRYRHLRGDLIN